MSITFPCSRVRVYLRGLKLFLAEITGLRAPSDVDEAGFFCINLELFLSLSRVIFQLFEMSFLKKVEGYIILSRRISQE